MPSKLSSRADALADEVRALMGKAERERGAAPTRLRIGWRSATTRWSSR